MSILKILKKTRTIKLYRTIQELPIWNWDQVKKTNDLRYLIKLNDYDTLPKVKVPEKLWTDLLAEYKKDVEGDSASSHFYDRFVELQLLKKKEIIFSCDEYNPKLSVTTVKRKQLEKELENAPKGKAQTLEDQAMLLEIFFKIPFNVKATNTFRWYKYLQEYERRIAELSKQQERSKNFKKA